MTACEPNGNSIFLSIDLHLFVAIHLRSRSQFILHLAYLKWSVSEKEIRVRVQAVSCLRAFSNSALLTGRRTFQYKWKTNNHHHSVEQRSISIRHHRHAPSNLQFTSVAEEYTARGKNTNKPTERSQTRCMERVHVLMSAHYTRTRTQVNGKNVRARAPSLFQQRSHRIPAPIPTPERLSFTCCRCRRTRYRQSTIFNICVRRFVTIVWFERKKLCNRKKVEKIKFQKSSIRQTDWKLILIFFFYL